MGILKIKKQKILILIPLIIVAIILTYTWSVILFTDIVRRGSIMQALRFSQY